MGSRVYVTYLRDRRWTVEDGRRKTEDARGGHQAQDVRG